MSRSRGIVAPVVSRFREIEIKMANLQRSFQARVAKNGWQVEVVSGVTQTQSAGKMDVHFAYHLATGSIVKTAMPWATCAGEAQRPDPSQVGC